MTPFGAAPGKQRPSCAFSLGAGDGNRTRTISLGAVPSGPVTWPDLRGRVSASDRERPLVTGVNGPLMARRSSSELQPGGFEANLGERSKPNQEKDGPLRGAMPGMKLGRAGVCVRFAVVSHDGAGRKVHAGSGAPSVVTGSLRTVRGRNQVWCWDPRCGSCPLLLRARVSVS